MRDARAIFLRRCPRAGLSRLATALRAEVQIFHPAVRLSSVAAISAMHLAKELE
jgi:hypothetical protein